MGITNDPVGRATRADLPDGSYTKTVYAVWRTEAWDQNDTLDDANNEWRIFRLGLPANDPRHIAYDQASAHAGTPSTTYLDTLARPFLAVAHNIDDTPAAEYLATRTDLDIEGLPKAVHDPLQRACQTHVFSIGGQLLKETNIDKGARTIVSTVLGEPWRRWDDRDQLFRPEYDELRRPTHLFLKVGAAAETLLERRYYGDDAEITNPENLNLKGKPVALYDGAGLVELGPYDFKGNLLASARTLWDDHTVMPDWIDIATETSSADAKDAVTTTLDLLESETFSETRAYDALNRITSVITHDDSEFIPTYNEASLLEAVDVKIRAASSATSFVKNIDYDAKGQRTRIEYSSDGTDARFETAYTYDPLTFRLEQLVTTKASNGAILQDLQYTFDAVGNIVRISDGAQQSLFYADQFVAPANQFLYDAVYRLTSATGREHTSIGDVQVDNNDQPIRALPLPTDPNAMRNYEETYQYDKIGNILQMFHDADSGAATWTRGYDYTSGTNRLATTTVPAPVNTVSYTHDAHGNMVVMPHLAAIDYSPFDQMMHAEITSTQHAYYQYDASGNRVRKVIDTGANLIKERIYLGGFEIYREHVSGSVWFERETLHVMDGVKRMAMVETKTREGGSDVTTIVSRLRFQLANHLGSALLEVDENGSVISYEEMHPYGTSAYRSADGTVDVSARRYRYNGKERDEETGLYYYGARYYAAWLGRWTAADPLGIGADGPGVYNYVRGSPVTLTDPNGTDSTAFALQFATRLNVAAGRNLADKAAGPSPLKRFELPAPIPLAKGTGAESTAHQGGYSTEERQSQMLSAQSGAGTTMQETVAAGARTEADPMGWMMLAAGAAFVAPQVLVVTPQTAVFLGAAYAATKATPEESAVGFAEVAAFSGGAGPTAKAEVEVAQTASKGGLGRALDWVGAKLFPHADELGVPVTANGAPLGKGPWQSLTKGSGPAREWNTVDGGIVDWTGSKALQHLRSHSQDARTTARKLGWRKLEGIEDNKSFLSHVVREGDLRVGSWGDVGQVQFHRLGDALVIRRMNGQYITNLDFAQGGNIVKRWNEAAPVKKEWHGP